MSGGESKHITRSLCNDCFLRSLRGVAKRLKQRSTSGVFFEVTDGHAELIARDGLILEILRLTERVDIAFESPTLLLDRNGQACPAPETAKGVTSPST
jgi:hypothetical protein